MWHRDSGVLLETLTGHGAGSVNDVAWNPIDMHMFASCSDDGTVRIWESPSGTAREYDSSANLDGHAYGSSHKGKGRESASLRPDFGVLM